MDPAMAAGEAGTKATSRLHGGNHGPECVDGAELYLRTLGAFYVRPPPLEKQR